MPDKEELTETVQVDDRHFVYKNLEAKPVMYIKGKETEIPCAIVKETLDMEEMVRNPPDKYSTTLYLVPEEISEEHKEDVMTSMGITEEMWENKNVRVSTIADYGLGVPVWSQSGEDISEISEDADSTAPAIQGLVGFFLDKPINRIGSTGWDVLKDAVANESYIDAGLERVKEMREKKKLKEEVE